MRKKITTNAICIVSAVVLLFGTFIVSFSAEDDSKLSNRIMSKNNITYIMPGDTPETTKEATFCADDLKKIADEIESLQNKLHIK